MDVNTYLSTNVLDTFIEILSVGNQHVDVVVVVVSVWGAHVTRPGARLGLCVEVFLTLSLLGTHMGYLHLVRAFLMCSCSLSNSWWGSTNCHSPVCEV